MYWEVLVVKLRKKARSREKDKGEIEINKKS